MGMGYIIGCNKCFTEVDLHNIWRDQAKIKGTFFNIRTGGVMFCFCKEQLERIYGINKDYNRKYRLLAAGDPPNEIYKLIGSATSDKEIDKIIFDKIKNGFEFTEILGKFAYYCKTCKKLYTHFYFEMKKNDEIYIPEYFCKKCSDILGIANLSWDKYRIVSEDDLAIYNELENDKNEEEIINYKYNIYNENDEIKIESKYEYKEEKLICDNCGNDKFSLKSEYYVD
jgi:hypothetical protein